MNRGNLNPRPEQSLGPFGYSTLLANGTVARTTAGAMYCVMCLPRTELAAVQYPSPPSNPYYPLILGF